MCLCTLCVTVVLDSISLTQQKKNQAEKDMISDMNIRSVIMTLKVIPYFLSCFLFFIPPNPFFSPLSFSPTKRKKAIGTTSEEANPTAVRNRWMNADKHEMGLVYLFIYLA